MKNKPARLSGPTGLLCHLLQINPTCYALSAGPLSPSRLAWVRQWFGLPQAGLARPAGRCPAAPARLPRPPAPPCCAPAWPACRPRRRAWGSWLGVEFKCWRQSKRVVHPRAHPTPQPHSTRRGVGGEANAKEKVCARVARTPTPPLPSGSGRLARGNTPRRSTTRPLFRLRPQKMRSGPGAFGGHCPPLATRRGYFCAL